MSWENLQHRRLLALVRPALQLLEPEGVLAVNSSQTRLQDDLSAWCRIERHEYLSRETLADGLDRYLIARGASHVLIGDRESAIFPVQSQQPIRAVDVTAAVPMPPQAETLSDLHTPNFM